MKTDTMMNTNNEKMMKTRHSKTLSFLIALAFIVLAALIIGIVMMPNVKTSAASNNPTTSLLGDVDGNGKVTASDARLALRAAVALEHYAPGSGEFVRADYDGDGNISASDARMILRTAVELEPLKYLNTGEDTTDPANPENPTKPTEPSSEPEETSTEAEDPQPSSGPLPTSKYTEENDPYYYCGGNFDTNRAGMCYYELRAGEYIHFDYEDIPEGGRYIYYTDEGWCLPVIQTKPYSPGNEPTTLGNVCVYCGKSTMGRLGEDGLWHDACALGGCCRSQLDWVCEECGANVPANTCHTCGN